MSKENLQGLVLIRKDTLAWACFCVGMGIAFLGSLNPWFLWPLGGLYIVPAGMFIAFSMLVSNTMSVGFFNRRDFLAPIFSYIFISIYILLVDATNVNGYIVNLFHMATFFSLFRLSQEKLQQLATFLCKAMALLLTMSIPFFFLYVLGFPLPSRDAQFLDVYSFSNYYFFLLDDRLLFWVIPRFQSVFLEPGHLGTATVLLLMTQIGKWKKWYNVVLLLATVLTFSLAAYVFLVAIVFFSLWIQRKHIVSKVIGVAVLLAAVVGGSIVYKQGDNMVYQLIVLRLEVEDDGKLSGDNRVTEDFQTEYESFLRSSDVLFGREYNERLVGNSGYRVFIYRYGFVGLLLIILLYATSMIRMSNDRRPVVCTVVISVLTFWVRAYPLWYANFIPIYILAYYKSGRQDIAEPIKSEQSCTLE